MKLLLNIYIEYFLWNEYEIFPIEDIIHTTEYRERSNNIRFYGFIIINL